MYIFFGSRKFVQDVIQSNNAAEPVVYIIVLFFAGCVSMHTNLNSTKQGFNLEVVCYIISLFITVLTHGLSYEITIAA